jgi:hypothetical protein
MGRYRRTSFAAAVILIVAAACTTVPPTASPATPSATATPTPRPTIVGPEWVQAAAERWDPGTPQWIALAHPDTPYGLGGSAHANPNGVTFTAAQARLWWDTWFASPVDLSEVASGLLPSNFVLSVDEMIMAHQLLKTNGVLPKVPHDYNPLGLPVIP